ncbi:MAG: M42 family metallopeptidase [Bacillota bacterium]
MENKKLLKLLSNTNGISGFENNLADLIVEKFSQYSDEIFRDKLGNVFAVKWAEENKKDASNLMLAAHMDEVGLMVKNIDEKGFLKFTNIGGIDPRTLLTQEVVIHGKEKVKGIIAAKRSHLNNSNNSEIADLDKLFIDTGLNKEKLTKIVNIGDMITIDRNFMSLKNNFVSGKSLDDRAGVVMLYELLKELQYIKNKVNVHAVATVQEEVGVRGAITSTYNINPDIGIAIDVCHGKMPGVESDLVVDMDEGPAIAFGPHVHQKIFKKIKEIADDIGISYQIEPWPHPAGTDAWGIQISRSGVASALISIPLRYMHTSVETVSLNDIKAGAKLLAQFVARINSEFVEGLRCY